ncbi:hypothetical protein D3C80_1349080 [compost metagenome]
MVAVNAAAKLALGIVKMHTAQVVKAHYVAQLFKRLLAILFGTQVVTGGESVAGINTDTDTALVFYTVDDRRQMFKFEPQIAALPGGILDHCGDALGFIQHDVDRLSDPCQAFILIDLHQVAARVEVQQRQPQLLAALHLIKKRLAGLLQCLRYRMAKVNQIAVVRQDLPWAIAVLCAGTFKLVYHVGRQRGSLPLTLIFSEQGECGRL